MNKWLISGGTILTPDKKLINRQLMISNGKINRVSSEPVEASISLDADGSIIVPGLINAHDHLLGTYHPKVGEGPYLNWLPWDNDLKSSPVYQERQQIENRDLYLLGAYRNLVSGVTTVSDHIPHFVGDPYYDILPMKAIKDFALAHCVVSFALAWGDGITLEYQKALREDIPFVTHIAEGFDPETIEDVKTIERLGALGDHSVFVHCIAFSDEDMRRVRDVGASCVWCADSNMFMYNETTNIKTMLDMGINTCIGTDSPMTGGENLLYEMQYDRALYEEIYGEELDDELILRMVTANPAKAFHQKRLGRIEEGYIADLVIFRDKGDASASSVVGAGLRDVQLVVIDGKPVYGDAEFGDIFDKLNPGCQEVVLDGVRKRVTGDLIGLLQRISRAVGFKKTFPFLPVEFEVD